VAEEEFHAGLRTMIGPSRFAFIDTADTRKLQSYIRLNLIAEMIALLGLSATRVWVVPSPWLDVVIGLLLGYAVTLVVAGWLAGQQRNLGAILTHAIATWVIILAITVIVPFALAIVPLNILLPAMLTVPYIRRFQLNALFGAATGVVILAAVAGRFQNGAGIEALASDWLLDVFAGGFIPVSAGLALVVAWQNHAAMATKTAAAYVSRARLVSAVDQERRRIERSLQYGSRQHLTVAKSHLQLARRRLRTGDAIDDVLEHLIDELQAANQELRALAHGIYPPELTTHGLAAALRIAARLCPLPVVVRAEGIGRYSTEVEASVYFMCIQIFEIVQEGRCRTPRVVIDLSECGGLSFEISVTWPGCDLTAGDLVSIDDRIGAVGGGITFCGRTGDGFKLCGRIPRPFLSRPGLVGWRRQWDRICAFLGRVWQAASRLYGRPPIAGDKDYAAEAGVVSIAILMAGSSLGSVVMYAILGHPAIAMFAILDLTIAMLMVWAIRAIRRGRVRHALLLTMVVIWLYALLLAGLAPAALYQTPLLMILPAILAIPHVERRVYQMITAVSVMVALTVALAGRLGPGIGIEERAPEPLVDAFVMVIITCTAILALFITSVNHAALVEQAQFLQDSRALLMASSDHERRRIERDLHDGAQQRLVAATIEARVTRQTLATNPAQLPARLTNLAQDLRTIDTELRHLATGVRPTELVEHGLIVALRVAAAQSPLPTTFEAGAISRLDPETETNVYFCCLEALQNAGKHAGEDATIKISLQQTERRLSFEIVDTGKGCHPAILESGHGYTNMRDRLTATGGTLTVETAPGDGVRVCGSITLPYV
jgi:signal transduction histidine kinase